MKKILIVFILGLISVVMCDCISNKSSYPRSATTIVAGECKSEAYLIQIFNLTSKDSLQICIENRNIDLKTMNPLDSMCFKGKTHYYFNIAVWRKPFSKNYYVYSLNHDFSKNNISKLFHKKDFNDDIKLSCIYRNKVYHCTLSNTKIKSVYISACQDSLAISLSNRISLLE